MLGEKLDDGRVGDRVDKADADDGDWWYRSDRLKVNRRERKRLTIVGVEEKGLQFPPCGAVGELDIEPVRYRVSTGIRGGQDVHSKQERRHDRGLDGEHRRRRRHHRWGRFRTEPRTRGPRAKG